MLVAYIAHPMGDEHSLSERGDQTANALAWFKFFINVTQWALTAPVQLYSMALSEMLYNSRRLVDQLHILERCDILILCGGYISTEMHEEIDRAQRMGIPVLDLTMEGIKPPLSTDESSALRITLRAKRVVVSRPRRVWLPLLTIHDIESLRDARHSLYAHMPNEHPAAVRLLDRIIASAVDSGL